MRAELRAIVLASLGGLLAGMPSIVKAALLEYEFNLVASGSIDRGVGPTDFENLEIVVTGRTTSDVDTRPEPEFGQYASSSVYDLGALGLFVTDSSTDETYVQVGSASLALIQIVGLFNTGLTAGFGPVIPPFPGDPSGGGIPIGTDLDPVGVEHGSTYRLTNLAGETLALIFPLGRGAVTSFSVTASVSEPATTALLALGLLAAGRAGRRHWRSC